MNLLSNKATAMASFCIILGMMTIKRLSLAWNYETYDSASTIAEEEVDVVKIKGSSSTDEGK